MCLPPHARRPRPDRGFSLIEVLVTIVILCVGLLGSVGMQAAALQANAQTRHQVTATALASELAEAMRGNHLVALEPEAEDNPFLMDYSGGTPASPEVDCQTGDCLGVDKDARLNAARWLVQEWQLRAIAQLPSPRIVVCFDTEPSFRCSVLKKDGTWADAESLLEGVESFQVLYGTDGVKPGLAPDPHDADGVADRWLRADELTVASNAAATRANWRRVRAVRIGLVVRGPVGSAISRETQVLHPLGAQFASNDDLGSNFNAPADGRLRTTRSITLHLRNNLSMP